ncbi:MAG: sulfocyanin-like copper-binding protein [Bacilli bacterium]
MKFVYGLAGLIATTGLILTGCGTNIASTVIKPSWFAVNTAQHTVRLTVDAGVTSANGWANFNGYANGLMTVDIPVGYKVKLNFQNTGGIPFGVGIYNSVNRLAFPNAGMSVSAMVNNSAAGVFPGQSQTFTFVASKVGAYRMENLLDRIDAQSRPENFGMWDWFNVTAGGTPHVLVSGS